MASYCTKCCHYWCIFEYFMTLYFFGLSRINCTNTFTANMAHNNGWCQPTSSVLSSCSLLLYSVYIKGIMHTQENNTRNYKSTYTSLLSLWDAVLCKFFLHRIECSSVPHKMLTCMWPKLWGFIGRLCFWLASSMIHIIIIVCHVCCESWLYKNLHELVSNLVARSLRGFLYEVLEHMSGVFCVCCRASGSRKLHHQMLNVWLLQQQKMP